MPPRQQHQQSRGIRGASSWSFRFLYRAFSIPVQLVVVVCFAQTLFRGDHNRIAQARERRLHKEQENIEGTRWQDLRTVEQDQDQAAEEENKRWK